MRTQSSFGTRFASPVLALILVACMGRNGLPDEVSGEAPFVDSKTAKTRFAEITEQDMEMLRGKKILFASRSFGLNLCNGLRSLAKQDEKYEILSSYERFDVFKASGDVNVILSMIWVPS